MFSKVRFFRKLPDLIFSTDPKSICAVIFEWLNISTIPTEFKAKLCHSNINNIARFI